MQKTAVVLPNSCINLEEIGRKTTLFATVFFSWTNY